MEQWNCIFIKINLYINIFMRKCGCPQNKGKVDNLSHTPKSRHLRTRERGGAGKKKSANFCDVFCGRFHHNFIVQYEYVQLPAVQMCALLMLIIFITVSIVNILFMFI